MSLILPPILLPPARNARRPKQFGGSMGIPRFSTGRNEFRQKGQCVGEWYGVSVAGVWATREQKTKAQLTLEMVRQARREGRSYRWVGGHEVYINRKLIDALEEDAEVFLLDIGSTHQLWD